MTVKERFQAVETELQQVCKQAGRSRDEVVLVAVSKTVGPHEVAAAIEAAVAQINSEGDSKVYYLPLALATDMHLNHPTAAAYGPSGEKLIDIIEEITGW